MENGLKLSKMSSEEVWLKSAIELADSLVSQAVLQYVEKVALSTAGEELVLPRTNKTARVTDTLEYSNKLLLLILNFDMLSTISSQPEKIISHPGAQHLASYLLVKITERNFGRVRLEPLVPIFQDLLAAFWEMKVGELAQIILRRTFEQLAGYVVDTEPIEI